MRYDQAHPVRVTTIVDSLLSGGAERVAVELACALDRDKFIPDVLVTRKDGSLCEILERSDVPYTILGRTKTIDVRPWRAARKHVKKNTDLIHSHKFGSNAWASLIARLTGTPLIAHEHNFSETPSRTRKFIDKYWVARHASRILCVSDSVAETERTCGVPERLIEIVPNGVRIDAALPKDVARTTLGLSDSSFTVGIVGRLRPEKAHEVLLQAIAILACKQGRDVRLCVVGDGPRRSELQLLAGKLGISNRITWAGEHRNAATLAGAFDVGVICSNWEGLPLAALECMAAHTPLIASAVGGIPTLLRNDAGVLFPVGDADALARELALLMDDAAHHKRLSENGFHRVSEHYTFEGMVNRIQRMYIDVLVQQRSRNRITNPAFENSKSDGFGKEAA